jgi:hypothetical protein
MLTHPKHMLLCSFFDIQDDLYCFANLFNLYCFKSLIMEILHEKFLL